jgi:hypothetical protein
VVRAGVDVVDLAMEDARVLGVELVVGEEVGLWREAVVVCVLVVVVTASGCF